MRLYMKQKVFSWGDKFSVYDEAENVVFTVEGEVFTFGKKLHVYDSMGNEAAFIEQKLFSFFPKYSIWKNGCEVAEVVKEFTFFRQAYSVNGPGWQVEGDFFDHDYRVTFGGAQTVASVSKEWFTFGDAYEINISSEADPVLALSVVLVIDACIDAQND